MMDFKKHLKILPETIDKHKVPYDKLREFRLAYTQKFPVQSNMRILDAFLSAANFDRAPIWMMRQAGRYLPEFMEISKDFDFFAKCENPFLAAEITLQPLKRFDLDAAIIFADILTLPRAMGMDIKMVDKVGPVIENPLVEPADKSKLKMPEPGSLDFVYDAQFLVRLALQGKQTLIGFCGGPLTVLSYMIEGGSSKQFIKTKKWIYQWNEETKEILEMLARASADYLINQVKQGGAQVLQIFDSWAGILPAYDYIQTVVPSLQVMLSLVKEACPETPIIMFAKDQNNTTTIEALVKLNLKGLPLIDGFQVDPNVESEVIVMLVENDRVIQGNLEPGVLYGNQMQIRKRVAMMIEKLQTTRKYIANLGHGLTPEHSVESVKQFVEETIRQSKLYKAKQVLE